MSVMGWSTDLSVVLDGRPGLSTAFSVDAQGSVSPPSRKRLAKGRRPPVPRRLLVAVRQRDQLPLAPRAPEERDARRQGAAACPAHRHLDRREAGDGREELAVVAVRGVEVAD